ncbi:response regulator transcription factor [Rhodopseudomonas sp. BR0M22]|uniref:response regulator transcription factor n=1 Tax=Rhodopseudomonas sp. BR0M22 TaxID=2269369 RepID=UPI0013DE80DA|nr:response regulator transcription factor [Rhodopseudomonas sp. BR0M22]MCD0419801.1 response regulator transcription factor [Rubrivivax sp. JA1024]NEW91086.1 DNA-binding response regulator [Rhodopseudomonas sp. BR0M22]
MKILLVEDDRMLAKELTRALREQNFAVDHAVTGEDGQHLGETESYDAAVLDLGLPKVPGVEVLQRWRKQERHFPVLILTARDGWTDKVDGFKAGADDYLTKPFRVEELVMRLRALVRRSAGHAASRISCGPLTFEAPTGQFELGGLPLKLTALEWRVLECLMMRKENVVERSLLSEKVYEGDVGTDSNSIEVIVARLRKKIGKSMIETERGRGYKLTAGV